MIGQQCSNLVIDTLPTTLYLGLSLLARKHRFLPSFMDKIPHLFQKRQSRPQNVRNHISLRLQRSQNLPLFISLRDIMEKRKSLAFRPGLDVIAPEHHRWKQVVFELSPLAVETFVESQSLWSFDLLESFSLEVPNDWQTPSPSFPPDMMFDEAANFTDLTLQNIRIHASDFPWWQLTSL